MIDCNTRIPTHPQHDDVRHLLLMFFVIGPLSEHSICFKLENPPVYLMLVCGGFNEIFLCQSNQHACTRTPTHICIALVRERYMILCIVLCFFLCGCQPTVRIHVPQFSRTATWHSIVAVAGYVWLRDRPVAGPYVFFGAAAHIRECVLWPMLLCTRITALFARVSCPCARPARHPVSILYIILRYLLLVWLPAAAACCTIYNILAHKSMHFSYYSAAA